MEISSLSFFSVFYLSSLLSRSLFYYRNSFPVSLFLFFHLTNELANLELNDKKDMRND